MTHIEKNGDKFKAIVEVGTTGNRKRRTKTFDRKRDAQSWMSSMINDQDKGKYVVPSNVTLGQFLDRWLEDHKKPKIAATTYDRYYYKINGHLKPDLGYIPLQQLEPYHLESYFANKRISGRHDGKGGGLSENTLKKHYVILNSAIKKAIKLKLIKYNPVKAVETPKPEKKETEIMSQQDYEKILDILKDDLLMFTFVFMDLMTGLRRSELLGLEWEDVDFNKKIIKVKKRLVKITGGWKHEKKTKNDSSRRKVKLSNKLKKILKRYKKEQAKIRLQLDDEYYDKKEFIFCRPDGYPYHPDTYNKKLNDYIDKAELSQKYTIHTLRHTFATMNVNNKISPEIVQKMLGHSTISTTIDIYYHHDTEMQKEAINKLDQAINID